MREQLLREYSEETHVAALYVHGDRPSQVRDSAPTPMLAMPRVDAVEGMGLRQDPRYFKAADPGRERKRQVSLIDEATIWRLEKRFGSIHRNLLKAQIILAGDVFLPGMIGSTLQLEGGAELTISLPRRPCFAMDLIKLGLRVMMEGNQQGALACITRSGIIAVGDHVRVLRPVEAAFHAPRQGD